MPIPEVQKLSPDSSPEQIKAAMSACVASEMQNGKPQDQAVAMCSSMVKAKTEPANPIPAQPAPQAPGAPTPPMGM